MPLAPLATLGDLAARGIVVASAEETVTGTFLAVASATVREAAGAAISEVTGTVALPGRCDPRLRLPGAPVTAVAAVDIDGDPVPAGAGWKLVDGVLYRTHGTGAGAPGRPWAPRRDIPVVVTVTYTAGLPEVPADVVDLVCRLVAAALVALRSADDGSGLAVDRKTSESIGDYSVSYDTATRSTDMHLAPHLVEALRSRFGAGAATIGTW